MLIAAGWACFLRSRKRKELLHKDWETIREECARINAEDFYVSTDDPGSPAVFVHCASMNNLLASSRKLPPKRSQLEATDIFDDVFPSIQNVTTVVMDADDGRMLANDEGDSSGATSLIPNLETSAKGVGLFDESPMSVTVEDLEPLHPSSNPPREQEGLRATVATATAGVVRHAKSKAAADTHHQVAPAGGSFTASCSPALRPAAESSGSSGFADGGIGISPSSVLFSSTVLRKHIQEESFSPTTRNDRRSFPTSSLRQNAVSVAGNPLASPVSREPGGKQLLVSPLSLNVKSHSHIINGSRKSATVDDHFSAAASRQRTSPRGRPMTWNQIVSQLEASSKVGDARKSISEAHDNNPSTIVNGHTMSPPGTPNGRTTLHSFPSRNELPSARPQRTTSASASITDSPVVEVSSPNIATPQPVTLSSPFTTSPTHAAKPPPPIVTTGSAGPVLPSQPPPLPTRQVQHQLDATMSILEASPLNHNHHGRAVMENLRVVMSQLRPTRR